jgi:hypothetical protein
MQDINVLNQVLDQLEDEFFISIRRPADASIVGFGEVIACFDDEHRLVVSEGARTVLTVALQNGPAFEVFEDEGCPPAALVVAWRLAMIMGVWAGHPAAAQEGGVEALRRLKAELARRLVAKGITA